ncbi:MAG: hypothetical protein WBP79_08300 [Candidatus Acidiferrales bacterium]
MRFEERELKPYAETVPLDELQVGAVYFAVNFVDDEMLIPSMEPKVFVGRNLEAEEGERLHFQDIDSYRRGVRFESATEDDEAIFETGTERHIFEFERALDVLMRCSLRRRKGPGHG